MPITEPKLKKAAQRVKIFAEIQPGPLQTSKMESFTTIGNSF